MGYPNGPYQAEWDEYRDILLRGSNINTELGNNQNDTDLTIIFGHHPITDTGYSDDTWLFYGARTFTTYLDSYGASLYGYGHTHRTAREIFTGDDYTGQMTGDGVVYFNTASLGKSTANQYAIVAIDCDGSTDSADSDCTSICKLRKEPCTDNADCCSNKCFRGACK